MNRTPYDGSPFYCVACDCGFGEFMACELPICKLETIEAAETRKAKHEASQASEGTEP